MSIQLEKETGKFIKDLQSTMDDLLWHREVEEEIENKESGTVQYKTTLISSKFYANGRTILHSSNR